MDRVINHVNETELETVNYINNNLESLRLQAKMLRNGADQSNDELKKKYNSYAKVCDREADFLRLAFRMRAETEETQEMIKNETNKNPKVIFEKFKK